MIIINQSLLDALTCVATITQRCPLVVVSPNAAAPTRDWLLVAGCLWSGRIPPLTSCAHAALRASGKLDYRPILALRCLRNAFH